MIEENFRSAYTGESQAHKRYGIFSQRAEELWLSNIARLFRAVAYAERFHASNHYRNITSKGDALTVSVADFGSRTTPEDLQIGIDGEGFEVNEIYPAYLEVAHMQKENAAEISFRYAWEAEKIYATFFRRAKKAVDSGGDLELGHVCVCSVWGYMVEGEVPDHCPIRKAKRDKFRVFSA